MLHVPKLGHTHFRPAMFAWKSGIYVMRITKENGTFTKIGETEGGPTNRTAEWGEDQQVIRFFEMARNSEADDVARKWLELQIREKLKHDGYSPLKWSDGTQTEDWFAEEALDSAITAIKKLEDD